MAIIQRIIGLIVLLALGVGAWFWFNEEEETQIQFRTVTLERGNFAEKVQATGTLEPQEIVDVGAQVTGEIMEFGVNPDGTRVDYGSEVKAGQLLARIDDTLVELSIKRYDASLSQAKAGILTANANVTRAKADIVQAKANNDKAQRNLERAKQLGVGEALSQMSYDEYVNAADTAAASLQSSEASLESSVAAVAQAEASLQSAQAQLDSELRNREYTRISSPVDGTIIVRQVNVGQTVVSNMSTTTLFLVAKDLTKMQIWTSVNEVDIAKIQAGQSVEYTVDGIPNKSFFGTVNKIRPNATMSSNVVTYVVEIDIDNPDRIFLPYMSAQANFIVSEQKDVLIMPNEAFAFRPAEEYWASDVSDPYADTSLAQSGDMKKKGERGGKGGEKGGRGEKGEMGPPEGNAPEGAPSADAPEIGLIWQKTEDDKVRPIRVRLLDNNGTHTVVRPTQQVELKEGMEFVSGVTIIVKKDDEAKGKGMLEMKRPARREQGTGGGPPKK